MVHWNGSETSVTLEVYEIRLLGITLELVGQFGVAMFDWDKKLV